MLVPTARSVGCVARVSSKTGPALIAQPQSSTNQLALSPGSPARPSNYGDKVRFVLGVILPDRRLSANSFVCVEAKVVSKMTTICM